MCGESCIAGFFLRNADGQEKRSTMQKEFQIGAIASVHGVRGEVKVFPTTDEPEKFKRLKSVMLKTEKEQREVKLQSARFFKNMAIVKLEGIESPEEAQKYRGATLWISREQAVPLRKDEYYRADLIGLKAVTEEGEELGILTDVLETGANDVYEVTLQDKSKVLFPAIKSCILEVAPEKGFMTVHVMEGLLEAAQPSKKPETLRE